MMALTRPGSPMAIWAKAEQAWADKSLSGNTKGQRRRAMRVHMDAAARDQDPDEVLDVLLTGGPAAVAWMERIHQRVKDDAGAGEETTRRYGYVWRTAVTDYFALDTADRDPQRDDPSPDTVGNADEADGPGVGTRTLTLDEHLNQRLTRCAWQYPNESTTEVARRLIDEGIRMHEHPGITFIDGPHGRAAALAAGPAVEDVIAAIGADAATDAIESGDDLPEHAGELTGLNPTQLRVALAYWTRWMRGSRENDG